MIGKVTNVIGIRKGKLIAAKIRGKKLKSTSEYNWDLNTFDLSFSKLVREQKIKSARVLIGANLSYVLRLKIPVGMEGVEQRRYISEKISEQIPEELSDSDWDFKELHFDVESTGQNEKEIIVFAPVKGLFDKLTDAARKLKVQIEVIEPEVVAAVRHKNPLVGVALKKDVGGKDMDSLNIKPSDILEAQYSDKKPQEDDSLLIDEAKKIKEEGIQQAVNKNYDSGDIKLPKSEKKRGLNKPVLVFVLILLGFLAGGGIYSYRNGMLASGLSRLSELIKPSEEVVEENEFQTTIEETEEQTPTPTLVEEIDLSEVSIQVQNGSGLAGEADFASDLLLAEGFLLIETDNADSFDNAITTASLKQGLSHQIYESIEQALNSEYTVQEGDALDESSEFDVVITVGERL